ncbi:MAG TPA: hypothetical protein VMO24_08585 [Woeseiaceae bacterium]|nr:hypothetical protein [Woeseiaceae bacterium]
MKTVTGISKAVALAAVAITATGADALAQNPFPEAPGRDTLMLACSQCHSIGKMVQADLNGNDWQFIVYDMIARGAPVHADDIATLTRYLQDNFATDEN